jgi:hypothetical protein
VFVLFGELRRVLSNWRDGFGDDVTHCQGSRCPFAVQ